MTPIECFVTETLRGRRVAYVPASLDGPPDPRFPDGLPLLVPVLDRRDTYRLVRAFTYITAAGKRITAPEGMVFDGATIPRLLWRVVGNPWEPELICAAVIHDYLSGRCGSAADRLAADLVFREIFVYQALVGPLRLWALYHGVRIGAWWRWGWVR